MIVLSRPRRDFDQWNNRGGRLVSAVDQRISIGAPRNAFRLNTQVSLQVYIIQVYIIQVYITGTTYKKSDMNRLRQRHVHLL